MASRRSWLKNSSIAGCLLLAAAPAFAAYGPRIIIGDVYQQTSTTSTVNGTNAGACENNNVCGVLFQPVPGARQLIIEHVACLFSVESGITVRTLVLSSPTIVHAVHLVPVTTSATTIITSQPVLFPLAAGERPLINAVFSAANDAVPFCTISGRLVTP